VRIGINLWTIYGWSLPERVSADILRAIGALGATSVELVLDDRANSADVLLSERAEIQAALSQSGLAVPSVASALFWRYNLASQDPSVRQRGIEIIRDGCRVAQAFDAKVFLVVAGQQEPRTPYAKTYATAVATLREAASSAADLGITIGVENVGTSFLCSPGEYAQFLADVDHPAVQAYLDFGNGASVGNGFGENWVSALRGRIALVHAKDYDRGLRVHPCCGQGDLVWEDVFAALRDVGYDDYLIVETPPREGRGQPSRAAGLAAAETSLRWLKRFIEASTGY
jgi:hexulose-6-phosphate isomerase